MNQLPLGPLKPPDSLPQHSRATRTQGSHPPLAALLGMSPHTATPPATQLCQLTVSHPAHNHHSSRRPLWPPTSSRGDKGTDGLFTAVKGENGLLWHKWLSQLCSEHHSSHLAAQAFTAGLGRQLLWGDGCTSGSLAQWQLSRLPGRQREGHSAPERLFQPRVMRVGMKTGGSISWCRWDSDMSLHGSSKNDLSLGRSYRVTGH